MEIQTIWIPYYCDYHKESNNSNKNIISGVQILWNTLTFRRKGGVFELLEEVFEN